MGIFSRYFKPRKKDEFDVEWCIYDPDVVCDTYYDCKDCCWYEEWLRRGRKDGDNFDDYGLDQSKFDYNHYDNIDEHGRKK